VLRLLLIIGILGFSFTPLSKGPDFEADLRSIVIEFENYLDDADKCRDLNKEASALSRTIKQYVNANKGMKTEKLMELKLLAKKATALKYYIERLRDTGWTMTPNDKFRLGNEVVDGEWEDVKKGAYCVSIIKITFDEYEGYLIENPGEIGMMVRYSWKKPHEIGGGTVTMPIYEKTVQKLFDTKTHPERKQAEIFNIKCTPFPGY